MVELNWCKNQSRGISLIESKPHLSESYLKDAHESLSVCLKSKGKWKVITGYYACYNAFYSVLMKCGIKCEIHDCTIKLMELFNFLSDEIKFVKYLKQERIQCQYYLKEVDLEDVSKVKMFILKCEALLHELNEKKINEVRNKLI